MPHANAIRVPDDPRADRETAPRTFYDETILDDPELNAGRRLALHAERLNVVKRDVRDRVATVTRRVVAVRKTFEVDVMHEELVIEYAPGDRTEMLEGEGGTIVVELRAEEVEIVKHVRVVEEVRLSKRRVSERSRIDALVRHEVLDIDEAAP